MCLQATVEKVLKTLSEDAKDVRKCDWSNKEVSSTRFPPLLCTIVTMMIKSSRLDQTQLIEAGVTPQHAFEIKFLLNPPRFLHSRFRVTWKVDDATVIHRSTSSTGLHFSRQNLLHTWSIYPRRTMSVRKINGCSIQIALVLSCKNSCTLP